MLSFIGGYLRSQDEIVKPSHTRLNFEGDTKQKTIIGGVISIAI